MTHKQIDELFDQYAHFVADGNHMRDILNRKDFHDLMKNCYPERTMPELQRITNRCVSSTNQDRLR